MFRERVRGRGSEREKEHHRGFRVWFGAVWDVLAGRGHRRVHIRRSRGFGFAVVAGTVERVYSEEGTRGEEETDDEDDDEEEDGDEEREDEECDENNNERRRRRPRRRRRRRIPLRGERYRGDSRGRAFVEVRRRRHRRRRERQSIRRLGHAGVFRRSERENREERFIQTISDSCESVGVLRIADIGRAVRVVVHVRVEDFNHLRFEKI